jgi:2-polyprenyl-3-methyl-5-hydroxy-6-metoxy-1,4-benzoquinol methylase
MSAPAAIDMAKLDEFLGKAVIDLGATFNAGLVVIGDKLGLYKAMAGAGPMTPAELASRTKTDERYVREWLSAQATGGYVTYDPVTQRFELPPEQAFALANPDGPVFFPAAMEIALATLKAEPRLIERFKTGEGLGWHEHDPGLFHGTERFFRSNYAASLVSSWIPALDGVEEKLKRGAKVADIGCGHGASTILMATAFPRSQFIGFDYHSASIECARQAAAGAGVAQRVTFEVAPAKEYTGRAEYDLVTFFDSLHDMGDPVGAAAHVLGTLTKDGTWMIVEPFASDKLEENLTPVGRVFYSASTMICTPASRSQEVGLALGAQAGEARLRDVVSKGGFTRFRRAAATPFNLVLEARP